MSENEAHPNDFLRLENKERKISIFGLQTSRSLGRKEQTKDRQWAAKKRENLLIFHKSSNSALKMRAVRLLNDKHYQLVKKGSHLEVQGARPESNGWLIGIFSVLSRDQSLIFGVWIITICEPFEMKYLCNHTAQLVSVNILILGA